MSFENKVALVTGAAGSIGIGIAKKLCENGTRVFITDINQKGLNDAITEIKKVGICEGLAADITVFSQVKKVVDNCTELYGERVDILVNVAGIVGQGKIEDIEEKQWDLIFDVNCKGTYFFLKLVVPYMKKNKYGKIVNFSSKSGKTGSALMSHYSAAKAAIIGLTQALAYELADNNINVNCVCPGITRDTGVWSHVSAGYVKNMQMPMDQIVEKFTNKIPLKRLASVEDIVAVTTFLVSDEASYMTGQAINITGGREMH